MFKAKGFSRWPYLCSKTHALQAPEEPTKQTSHNASKPSSIDIEDLLILAGAEGFDLYERHVAPKQS